MRRGRYNKTGRYSGSGVYRDEYSNLVRMNFEVTDTGYITPTIACSGADIYLDGVLAGSVDALGAELVVNGDFGTGDLTGWSVISGAGSVVNGEGVTAFDVANGTLSQQITVVGGKLYHVQGSLTATDSSGPRLKIGSTSGGTEYIQITTVSGYDSYDRSLTNLISLYPQAIGDGSTTVDNFSVKLVGETSLYVTKGQTVDFVFSDPSSVTYIDMRGDSLQGDASQFGQFSNLDELYLPDMEYKGTLGDELLTNASNPVDLTGWNDQDGWAATGGSFVGTADGTFQTLSQDFGGSVGVLYRIKYHVSQNSLVGTTDPVLASSSIWATTNISGDVGTHEYDLFAINAAPIRDFYLQLRDTSTSGTITIDYFSVKQVTGQSDMQLLTNNAYPTDLTGWTADAGWAATGNAFVCTADGTRQDLQHDFGASVGAIYRIKYHVSQNSLNDGKILLVGGGAFPAQFISSDIGTNIYEIFATTVSAADLWFAVHGDNTSGTITIDYFSIKAIANELVNGGFDDWTGVANNDQPDGWTVTESPNNSYVTENPAGNAQFVTDGTALSIAQTSVFTPGSQYRVSIDITDATDPSLAITDSGATIKTLTSTGTELFYYTGATGSAGIKRAGGAADMTVDNFLIIPWPQQSIGSIASLITPTIEVLYIDAASNVAWTTGAFDIERAMTAITLDAVNWTVDEVNAFFASLVVANDAGAVDCVVTLLNMIAPTGQGNTDATALAADGWTVTVNGTAY